MTLTDKTQTQAIRNTFVVFFGQLLARLLDLWAILLIARSFGETAFGQFSFAVAYVGYFAILIDLGFNMTFVREMVRSRDRQDDLLAGMLILKLILVGIGIGLAAVLILIPDYSMDTVRLVWIMTIALLISPKFPSIRLVYEQVFQARLRMEIPTLLRLLDGGLLVLLIYSIVQNGQPMYSVMVAYVISSLPGLAVILWASRRVLRPSHRFDYRMMMRLLKQALPVALLGVFATIYSRLDVLFLSVWCDDRAIGYYSAAYRLTEALRLLTGAVLTSLYPMMVEAAGRAKDVFVSVLTGGLKPLLIILMPACIVTTFLAGPLIELFFTSRYAPAGDALAILIWAELCLVVTSVLSYALIAMNRQKIVVGINGVMLLVNVVMNIQLIPQWAYIGSSIARVVTEGIGVIGYGLVIYRLVGWTFWRLCLSLLPGAGVLAAWLYVVHSLSISLPLTVISAAVVYGACLLITRVTTWQELTTLIRAFAMSR